MALKTFNLDAEIYKEFSEHCKENGISMSKKVENFIKGEVARLKGKKVKTERTNLKEGFKERVEHFGEQKGESSFKKYC